MNFTKSKSLALIVLGLTAAACDPFPATPGGAPAVTHIGTRGGNVQDVASTATGVVFNDVAYNAAMYVWFNRQMDGASIQAEPGYDPVTGDPAAIATACAATGSPLYATSTLPADALICYAPASPIDGGYIQLFHADDSTAAGSPADGGWWKVGSYVLKGTVKDSSGAPLAIEATFNVTLKPTLVKSDAYTIDIGWPKDDAATTYLIEKQVGTGAWTTLHAAQAWVRPTTTISKVNGSIRDWGLVPGTKYSYRITSDVAGATVSTIASTTLAAAPLVTAKPNPPSTVNVGGDPGSVQLAWGRIRDNAAGTPARSSALYRVERKLTTATTWTVVTTVPRQSASVVTYLDAAAPVGDVDYQVVPVFTDPAGGADVDGTPTETATVTVAF
jgi:hypothetical protein